MDIVDALVKLVEEALDPGDRIETDEGIIIEALDGVIRIGKSEYEVDQGNSYFALAQS